MIQHFIVANSDLALGLKILNVESEPFVEEKV
jgi:hypothetical protein